MIAKIIPSGKDNSDFPAVRYSLGKEKNMKGELLILNNFPKAYDMKSKDHEIRDYLKSTSNGLRHESKKNIKNPQFHVVISGKGKENTKDELKDISLQWLDKMGYGKQPSVIVFHNDSENNHVHIITSRVNISTGKKINDSNERYKSRESLNQILGIQIENKQKHPILDYTYFTKGQLMQTLDKYSIPYEKNGTEINVKFGKNEFKYNDDYFKSSIISKEDKARQKQIKAIFHKYKDKLDTNTFQIYSKNKTEYNSQFINELNKKFGLEIVFHKKDNLTPFGYSIIDHKNKKVYKGSDILKMNQVVNFTNNAVSKKDFDNIASTIAQNKYVANAFLKNQNLEFLNTFIKVKNNLKKEEFLDNWKNYQSAEKYLKDYNLEYQNLGNKGLLYNQYTKHIYEINSSENEFKNFLENKNEVQNELKFMNESIQNFDLSQIIKDFSYTLSGSEGSQDNHKKKKKRKGLKI